MSVIQSQASHEHIIWNAESDAGDHTHENDKTGHQLAAIEAGSGQPIGCGNSQQCTDAYREQCNVDAVAKISDKGAVCKHRFIIVQGKRLRKDNWRNGKQLYL